MNNFKMERVLVVGAGTMGQGIAQWMAQQNLKVELVESREGTLRTAQQKIEESWKKLGERKKFTPEDLERFHSGISYFLDFSVVNRNPDLVIEAIDENLDSKAALFNKLSQFLHVSTIFATNTSGLSVAAMARTFTPEQRKNFLGVHFFNPAPIISLVEIVESPWTSPNLSRNLCQWFKDQGKRPVRCQDRPGFIVNRLNRNFYGEAMRMAKTFHTPTFEEIDRTLREVAGFKMGPFELMDHIGIDINLSVTKNLWKSFFNEPRFAPHFMQSQLTESGRLGLKTGEGFFTYGNQGTKNRHES